MMDLDLISRVAARFVAAASSLEKGDILEVWMKKGNWWSEIRRGVQLEVKAVQGDQISLGHRGWAEGNFTLTLPAGQNLSGKFKLVDDGPFVRSMIVNKV